MSAARRQPEKKVRGMKKKKTRLRTKIKNRPKSRNAVGKKHKAMTGSPVMSDPHDPAVQRPDEGMQAMSQVILDFAGPLLETCDDRDAERKAISMAIFVWNSTLLPEAQRRQTLAAYLDQCAAVVPAEEVKTLSGYIDRLVEDKAARFADNRNQITNCTFGDIGDSRHIEVGYTLA
jgi:hypothetical protein